MEAHTIFIIDDQEHLSECLVPILATKGHRIHVPKNEREAFRLITTLHQEQAKIDLLIYVLNEPGITADSMLYKLREQYINIPFFVITGQNDHHLLLPLLRLGCRDIIEIPFEPGVIEERVTTLLNEIQNETGKKKKFEYVIYLDQRTEALIHDLKNMVQGCIGFADLARMDMTESDPAWEALCRVNATSTQAAEICRKLLVQKKNRTSSNKVKTDARLCIEHTKMILMSIAPVNIVIESTLPTVSSSMSIDPELFQQALFNIGMNSIQAMPGGGVLSIDSSWAEAARVPGQSPTQCLRITITDTGEGIPADDIIKLSDGNYTKKKSGSGIGLSIVRRFLEDHHGWYTINSTPGIGTVVSLFIPTLSDH